MKANDWLLEQGHITEIKRGKRSEANTKILNRALAKGVVFDDYPKKDVVVGRGKNKTVVEAVKPRNEYHEPEPVHVGKRFFEAGTKKERGHAEACMDCGVSLPYCIGLDLERYAPGSGHTPRVVATNGRGFVYIDVR